jgi:hypothetical protein
MENVLDLLLKADPAAVAKLPEKEYKVKRLSQLCGEPVVFKLKAMPYSKAYDISTSITEDLPVHILLAGVVEPNLKDKALLEKYGAGTPAELVKKLLLPGEIETISKTIEQLSGYRVTVLEEIKKN